ncbi:MAG: DNA polymerase III subunit delta [Polyangiales bacterium]|nr:DNA polymerase III subunit delta [Myxococcales bacterium]
MDIHGIIREARGGTLRPVYVLVGEERFLIDRAVGFIRRRVLEGGIEGFNEDVFQGKGLAGKSLAGAARTMPMMADRRFVLVRAADDMATAELEALVDYLESPAESACVVLLADKLDGRSKFAKAAKKHDVWIDAAPLKPAQARSFVMAEAKERGHAIAGDAADALVDAVGADLAAIDDALERLSLFVGEGKPIDANAVDACVMRVRTESIWALVDAVSQRNARVAIHATGSLLADREPPLRILAMVARQLRMVAKMREALQQGMNPNDAARQAGVPPFKAREFADSAKRFKWGDLERAFEVLAQTDQALKGSKRPGGVVLEAAMLELCSATAS